MRIGYVPHPDGDIDPATLASQLRMEHVTFLRVDFQDLSCAGAPDITRRLEAAGYRKAPVDVQPPRTIVLDLAADEDALLSGMKAKTRYNVRLAAKRGVTVRQAGPDELPEWYRVYEETAARDRIAIHSRRYYEVLFETAAEYPGEVDLSLLLAEHEGDILGGVIVARHARHAIYLYGASSNVKRNLMASYLLQWSAVRQAKAAGAELYDFFGIPPADAPGHPMHGLFRFKVGFGGRIVSGPGSYDRALQPLRYSLYRTAERVRNYYFKVLRKRGGGGS